MSDAAESLAITVCYAEPDAQAEVACELPAGACVGDALRAVADLPPFASLSLDEATVGVFNEVCERNRRLMAGDRVEIYRPLRVDPMTARLERARGA